LPLPAEAGALGSRLLSLDPSIGNVELRSVLPSDEGDFLAPDLDRSLLPSANSDSSLTIVTGRVRGTHLVRRAARLRGRARDGRDGGALLRSVFDVRGARPGDFYALIRDQSGQVLSFEFQRGRADVYRIERDAAGNLIASRETRRSSAA